MFQELERTKSELREVEVNQETDPLSFLLLGIDAQDSARGRSDTIIVLTMDPNDGSMKMVSIPRDTYTEIVGRGTQDKINHAYAFGGPDMTVASVENFLQIPIDYYIALNMEGFKGIVDAIGGVTLDNDMDFTQSGFHFEEGEISLDGEAALAFSRMRYEDPRGDHGRNDRQRQIVQAIIQEGAQLENITKAFTLIDVLGDNVRTNLSFDEMIDFQANYRNAQSNSETITFEGSGGMDGGIWYYYVSDEERNRVSNELREHLKLN
ncbi:LCP family protein [Bacillus tamaricis]|uniref:LCP family protein n=2 Tax=Evansella tamaricis TaxID=2069301 RepID=A0ABS6JIK9_9BACI|nr:LCP family protein [Evansella tamaricis]